MRILKAVDGSVLWLTDHNIYFRDSILKISEINGVSKSRIIFARREPLLDDHLLRLSLLDLYLDTFPYNAHSSAIDALLAGIPVITKIGTTFPGLVSASMLKAIGLSDLITKNLNEYEELAIQIGNDKDIIKKIKNNILLNKNSYPLFNNNLYTKNLENEFITLKSRFY